MYWRFICTGLIVPGLAGLMLSAPVFAQPTYSIDAQGPTVASGLVSEGDILTPTGGGAVPPPAVAIPGGAGGLAILPTGVGFSELDALSYGLDHLLDDGTNIPVEHHWTFSVDEFAVGAPGVPGPSVTTEGAFGAMEASADIYFTPTPPGVVPLGVPGINVGVFDGNAGTTPFLAPGLNLAEPNSPTPFTTDPGDNLDAWDLDTPPPPPGVPGTAYTTPVYYSLDSSFSDPLEATPPYNTATALSNGFVGGDVLVSTIAGGGAALFAPAFDLGLDLIGGTDSDDLDALVLWENGNGAWDPTAGPYSWLAGGTDMLLFSVRRGSALIGVLDGLTGIAITEGDILVPMGAGLIPGIFVPAESLGLATVRTHGVAGTFQGFSDDLDALDVQLRIIPEPATIALVGIGAVLIVRRRQKRAA